MQTSKSQTSSGDTRSLNIEARRQVMIQINSHAGHLSEMFRFKVRELEARYSGWELYNKLGLLHKAIKIYHESNQRTMRDIDAI